MLVAFELYMPGRGSWNGKWTGEDQSWIIIKKFRKSEVAKYDIASKIDKEFSYRWSDGWCACVMVRQIDSKLAQKLRKTSKPFNSYSWMVDSILKCGEVRPMEN